MTKPTLPAPTREDAERLGVDPRFCDFRNLLYVIWKQIIGREPTEAQYELAHQLQCGPQDQIDEAFRGFGKSYILGAFCPWAWLWDQSLNILVSSADKTRADQFTSFVLQILREVPELQHLAPTDKHRQRADGFDVNGAPVMQSTSMRAAGIFGNVTGARADIAIFDDVEVPSTSETQGMRDKLWIRTQEVSALLKPEGPRRIIVLGTPQYEDSIYNRMRRERGMDLWVWPSEYPNRTQVAVHGEALAPAIREALEEDPSLAGKPTEPERFPEEQLLYQRTRMGLSAYTLQFLLDTTLSDELRYPLRLRDLIVLNCDRDKAPERVIWSGTRKISDLPNVGFATDCWVEPMQVIGDYDDYEAGILAFDPSGRGKDETGWSVVKVRNGIAYWLACGGFKDGYTPETLTALVEIAFDYRVNVLRYEGNFGDGMVGELLKPIVARVYEERRQRYFKAKAEGKAAHEPIPPKIDEFKATKQKELRILATLEPVFNQHRLVVHRGLVEADRKAGEQAGIDERQAYQACYQITRLTKERGALAHDDRVESLAQALDYLRPHMALDSERGVGDLKRQRDEAEFDAYLEELQQMGLAHLPKGKVDGKGWFGTSVLAQMS